MCVVRYAEEVMKDQQFVKFEGTSEFGLLFVVCCLLFVASCVLCIVWCLLFCVCFKKDKK